MKKIFFCFILFFVLFLDCLTARAVEYPVNTLIPVGELATVRTNRFDYNDFTFLTTIERGNGTIRLESIHNNLSIKSPVSINILLFNQKKTNIGFLTYCSEKDFDGQYASYVLKGNGYSSYSITVSKKYFGDEWGPSDVSYIAVMDENEFCHIGGYKNYIGKTIEEISSNEIAPSTKQIVAEKVKVFLKSELFVKILIGLGIFIAYMTFCSCLDSLHKRMFMHGTNLNYLPIANMFVTVKMVYGRIVAPIYLVLLVISGVLYFLKIHFLLYAMIIFWILALVLAFIKSSTKKYDLFYLEPSINSSAYFGKKSTKESKKESKDTHTVNNSFGVTTSTTNDLSMGANNSSSVNDLNNIYNNNNNVVSSNNTTGLNINYNNTVNSGISNTVSNPTIDLNSTNMNAPLSNGTPNPLSLDDSGQDDSSLYDEDYGDDYDDDDSDLSKFY